ncbi:unnamed protein product [Coffea canephora]|uniref:DH200=94 genomic scaffold, scaffold_2109 n=1 Tax=Coffea canephora TaxID=49390 RepID=A0A068VMP3_COFCA|nr:unnamed protein product [Coffea canephora]
MRQVLLYLEGSVGLPELLSLATGISGFAYPSGFEDITSSFASSKCRNFQDPNI